MKEIKAIIRRERIDRVARALFEHGVGRFWTCHVHALGSGVDPEHYRLSAEEGAAYTEKAKVELVCENEEVPRLLALIREHASTGRPGDGVVYLADVERVINVRTGDEDALALI